MKLAALLAACVVGCVHGGICLDEVTVISGDSDKHASCFSAAQLTVETVNGVMLARCTCPRDGGPR